MNYHAWVIGKIKVLQVCSVRISVKTVYTACISQFDFNHKKKICRHYSAAQVA